MLGTDWLLIRFKSSPPPLCSIRRVAAVAAAEKPGAQKLLCSTPRSGELTWLLRIGSDPANDRPHPMALAVTRAPVGWRPCWVTGRRVRSGFLIARAADAAFARSAVGSAVVVTVRPSSVGVGRASWFAAARLAVHP